MWNTVTVSLVVNGGVGQTIREHGHGDVAVLNNQDERYTIENLQRSQYSQLQNIDLVVGEWYQLNGQGVAGPGVPPPADLDVRVKYEGRRVNELIFTFTTF